MKFAKELDDDLVPEWRAKYLDYKQAKKRIKAVTRAIRNANRPPRTPKLRSSATTPGLPPSDYQGLLGKRASDGSSSGDSPPQAPNQDTSTLGGDDTTSAIPIPAAALLDGSRQVGADDSQRPLRPNGTVWTRYGSIIGSPPLHVDTNTDSLQLPEPALDTDYGEPGYTPGHSPTDTQKPVKHTRTLSFPHLYSRRDIPRTSDQHSAASQQPPELGSVPTPSINAFEVGKTKHPAHSRHAQLSDKHKNAFSPVKTRSLREKDAEHKPLFRRILNRTTSSSQQLPSFADVPLEALEEIDAKQEDFWRFLDKELDKVEGFYKAKEDEANHRLSQLREQLHTMRDQRLEEIMAVEAAREKKRHRSRGHAKHDGDGEEVEDVMQDIYHVRDTIPQVAHGMDVVYHPIQAAKRVRFGSYHVPKNNLLATPPTTSNPSNWDYTRKPEAQEIPYHSAKRKLKTALQEFYRGLELLKSYVLLNRTAFRKINKKYDKAVHARPTMRYMNDKVNNAWFVKSTVLDGHITAVEDLYARYFEKGNHKIAVGKLRKKNANAGSYTGSVFRNGLMVAGGLVFGIEGLVYGVEKLSDPDATIVANTGYLLQLYAGYLLMLYLTLFFCLDCRLFNANKINYSFVFEFDTRHNLDWRQLSEFPCFFTFLLGLTMWLNFTNVGGEAMYIYWPVVLVGITAIILAFPAPILYHHSRKWLLYSMWRLLFAGLYPVEFRDFFLGDMFCSLTYAMGNIELFFCLYAHYWNDPPMCNSSHSRLLGFFTTWPGIWRLLQCFRRYRDTRNIFPHLWNGLKYGFTIMSAVTLSLYRIDKTNEFRAMFIVFSFINSVYASIWDLLMDFSLFDPSTSPPFLRKTLGYKRPSLYYAAMILDPILRFNWIFYAIYAHDVQHSAALSFFVAFSEVTRRGMWTVFRVENEHCTNVGRFRASRDVPLPYHLPDDEEAARLREADNDAAGGHTESMLDRQGRRRADTASSNAAASPGNLSAVASASTGTAADGSSLRRRITNASSSAGGAATAQRTPSIRTRVGNLIHFAHAQDFERRRPASGAAGRGDDDDDDDEDDEDEDELGGDEDEYEAAGFEAGGGEDGRGGRAESRRRREAEREVREENRTDMLGVDDLLRHEARSVSPRERRGSSVS